MERGRENKQDNKETEADSKTMEVDGEPSEVWRHSGEGIEEWA